MSYEGGMTNIYDNVDLDRFSTTESRDIMNECGIKNCRGFYYTFSGKEVHEGLLGLNSDFEILVMLPFIPSNRHIVVYVDHDVDVSDVIEEVYTQSLGTQYEEFFNDIPNECFSQVDENVVKTQGNTLHHTHFANPQKANDHNEYIVVNDDETEDSNGEVAEGNGKASLHNVLIYEDGDDESDKEIYEEENDATLEIPKVPIFVDKKKQKNELVFMVYKKKRMSLLYLKVT